MHRWTRQERRKKADLQIRNAGRKYSIESIFRMSPQKWHDYSLEITMETHTHTHTTKAQS